MSVPHESRALLHNSIHNVLLQLVDRSIRRYGRMDTVRGKGPVLSFSGPGDEVGYLSYLSIPCESTDIKHQLDSAEKEYILLTLLLFRCLAAAT